jgi:hypothetical protein
MIGLREIAKNSTLTRNGSEFIKPKVRGALLYSPFGVHKMRTTHSTRPRKLKFDLSKFEPVKKSKAEPCREPLP